MSTIVRDMLRIADVRNAVGANGIQITGTPNSVGIVGLETTVRDRIFDRHDLLGYRRGHLGHRDRPGHQNYDRLDRFRGHRVHQRRQRQDEKWGVQNHGASEWLAILVEEIGEAAKELVEWRFGSLASDGPRERCCEELVQASAVALAAAECMVRNGGAS
jgi:hypothetical protein